MVSPVNLRIPGVQMNKPEDREEIFTARRPGLESHGGLKRPGSSSSASKTPQRPVQMNNGKKEVKTGFKLGRTWGKIPEDMSQRDIYKGAYGNHQRLESKQEVQTTGREGSHDKGESSYHPRYRAAIDPERAYYDSVRIKRSGEPAKLPSGFKPLRNQ
ncbi:hypothetical protein O181_088360 [Austropuccinia psidii MF-1]|uniref:Uncharacterized protein n=1 Tax=Austropuccinia psidii MF-1 TaxID=1389203 RepID=A0A9Q3P3T8_9BASI|nr:hypothetical protein [Austropuccinia psidii MF-1]